MEHYFISVRNIEKSIQGFLNVNPVSVDEFLDFVKV